MAARSTEPSRLLRGCRPKPVSLQLAVFAKSFHPLVRLSSRSPRQCWQFLLSFATIRLYRHLFSSPRLRRYCPDHLADSYISCYECTWNKVICGGYPCRPVNPPALAPGTLIPHGVSAARYAPTLADPMTPSARFGCSYVNPLAPVLLRGPSSVTSGRRDSGVANNGPTLPAPPDRRL